MNKNSVLLTEDKKAFKKVKSKNKVRFNLNCEDSDTNCERNVIKRKRNAKKINNKKNKDASLISNFQENKTSEPKKLDDNEEKDKNNNVINVYLANNLNKFFKYDSKTLVRDIMISLKEKLFVKNIDYYGLCINTNKDPRFFYLNENLLLDEVIKDFEDCNSIEFKFRLVFKPPNLESLVYEDIVSFNYLYQQVSNLFI
jgi:hypothetical protein